MEKATFSNIEHQNSLNRTIVELKFVWHYQNISVFGCLNRTIVELKFIFFAFFEIP